MLHLASSKTIGTFNADPFGQMLMYASNADGAPLIIGADMSYNDGGNIPAGFLGIIAAPTNEMMAFGIFTVSEQLLPFSVAGDGTVVLGYDVSSSATPPFAQLDVRKYNSYDYIINAANSDNTENYLTVHNDGYVGIGYANSGNATLQVVTPAGATGNAGVLITGNAPNNRYLFIGDGTNPASAAAFLTVKNTGVGIGIDDLSGGAKLAVKGSSNTILDLFETSSTVTNNAQIRFIANDGSTVRHKITEDASGSLLIDAGYSTAQDKVKIDGALETTGNLVVNGSLTIIGSSANQFKVGTDGKVRAREVQVDLQTIPDYVFNKNYKLPTIEQLQAFIAVNKHLPNVPGECEYEQQGSISLGELNLKLLEKVEELSLYIIQLNERIKQLEK